jgi:hypothetical protein
MMNVPGIIGCVRFGGLDPFPQVHLLPAQKSSESMDRGAFECRVSVREIHAAHEATGARWEALDNPYGPPDIPRVLREDTAEFPLTPLCDWLVAFRPILRSG